ncbi:hypothetical protein DE146DRAFT_608460 [Phaeosphaeria sp. MPI-PUGE-AT-0046c]|nr:hypothetical protein DE146DRAFT_608460 [Phaeosphaeria sp. MPI-PUGE-AT-0046c]
MVGQFVYPRSAHDVKRERDVFGLHAAFRDIPNIESLGLSPDTHAIPSEYVPKPAADPSLAAFCQLAAMRLNAARSLISLIDDKYQYILAEATPNTSLRIDSPLNKANDLGFGNVRLPRRWGICERVLDPEAVAEGPDGIVIINDFTKNEQYSNRSYVRDGPLRFYAGVPLTLRSGSIVGAVCILDNVARDGLSQDDIIYLQDLAEIIVDYLDTYAIKDRYRRAAEGLNGLMSFAEGGTTSRPSSERCHSSQSTKHVQAEATLDSYEQIPAQPQEDTPSEQPSQQRSHSPSTTSDFPDSRRSLDDLQNDLLPATTKSLFARASTIMRRANDMSGVMFIDASYASRGVHKTMPLNTGRRCKILGFATDRSSSLNGDVLSSTMEPYESNFRCVLEQYPHGYSLECDEGDDEMGYDNNVHPFEKSSPPADGSPEGQKLKLVTNDRFQLTASVKALIPDAKSALFMPLWDFERRRWFAGCFCWSTKTERVLDGRLDLPFLKAFGHSIMHEVARLDAMSTSQAKTTFLSSLSHELRTPLHGILGSVHLMRNSRLDNFQCDVGFVTEEVVETRYECRLIVGESPFSITLDGNGQDEHTSDQPSDQASNRAIARRRSRFIILDISDYRDLGFCLSASSFGRIVMNLFGNALKFTETGYVHVTVRSEEISGDRGTIVFTVSDTGIGMSRHFLLENAFEPFRKQSQHTSGTGVGLSVVRRILEDIGGQINVSSEPSKGTDIVLKLPLQRVTAEEGQDPKMNPLPAAMLGLKGRKVCVLHPGSESSDVPGQDMRQQSPITGLHTPPNTPFNQSSQFRPKLGLYPPLAIRATSSSKLEYTLPQEQHEEEEQTQAPPANSPAVPTIKDKVKISQALIVDDNAINRRLLSAWMKKHKIPYKEAKDGQEALDTYKDANGAFELILMDISMPKMDGMTSTRLIREHEKENNLTPAHVIALTGLTSASAKLEAWTSGVDDFLTKPVDFKKLESLMDAGRGGEGTGFISENKATR